MNHVVFGCALMSLVGVWGCTGMEGFMATQLIGQAMAYHTQAELYKTMSSQQPGAQKVEIHHYQHGSQECRYIDGKKFCAEESNASVPNTTSSNSRKEEFGCVWKRDSSVPNRGVWVGDCPSRVSKSKAKPPPDTQISAE